MFFGKRDGSENSRVRPEAPLIMVSMSETKELLASLQSFITPAGDVVSAEDAMYPHTESALKAHLLIIDGYITRTAQQGGKKVELLLGSTNRSIGPFSFVPYSWVNDYPGVRSMTPRHKELLNLLAQVLESRGYSVKVDGGILAIKW